MRKRTFILLIVLISAINSYAQTFEYEGKSYNITSETQKTVSVTEGSAYSGNEYIPSSITYNGTEYSVTSIEAGAISGWSFLESIHIPSSIKTIGEWAFAHCEKLERVEIEGSPTIGPFAFYNCPNITDVISLGSTPGKMEKACSFPDREKDIMTDGNATLTPSYNSELGRTVWEITYQESPSWTCLLSTLRIPAGAYSVKIGILPSKDLKPNLFHPLVKVYTMESEEIILTDEKEKKGSNWVNKTYTNDISGYDSILIADTLVIPEGTIATIINLSSEVNNDNLYNYSGNLILDKIFFEPINEDSESVTGPFTVEVYNSATLHVTSSALSAYQTADGWKYFKNINTLDNTTKLTATDNDKNNAGNMIIHDITGRRVKTESIEQLAPGLYIINNRKYMVR